MKEITPEIISAFEASLKNLPAREVHQRKVDFVREFVEAYGLSVNKSQKVLIFLGIASVLFLPIFIVSIPIFVHFLATSKFAKQKIRWALETWKEDLGEDYPVLVDRLRSFWR